MRVIAFARNGRRSIGLLQGNRVIDVTARKAACATLVDVLRSDGLSELQSISQSAADYAFDDVELLKPIDRPDKILCVGVNYRDRPGEYRDGTEPPRYPSLFVRFPGSLVAHGADLVRPRESIQLDYEGELAIVIGRAGRRIAEAQAHDFIAGFTVANDGSVRDWIRHGRFNVTPGKNFERSGSLGPWLVTTDDVPDEPLKVRTTVNGDLRQDATTDQMLFPIPFLIAYISSFCELLPGDVIFTGTPSGAGARFDPPRYLVPGDRVEVDVSHVGTLVNTVAGDE
jgi:2-keto-4-pentenoate hydratase/2-oxohepta-3-ene-1,7-dioic acid hydratase in catechol pathway